MAIVVSAMLAPMAFGQSAAKAVKKATVKSKPPVQTAIVATDEGMADAVLADALDEMWVQVDRHHHKGEHDHIVALCRLIVQGDPSRYDAYEDAAWLLWGDDHNAEAVAFLKQGVAANPKVYNLYDELGAHYNLHLKDPASAIPYYEKAVKLNCPAETWHNLAHCYEKTNQWDKAINAWETAAKIPGQLNPTAIVNLQRVRAKYEQARPKR